MTAALAAVKAEDPVSSYRKELGRIERCDFGQGGYNDAEIGIGFTLSGKGWGVQDFWGYWSTKRSDY